MKLTLAIALACVGVASAQTSVERTRDAQADAVSSPMSCTSNRLLSDGRKLELAIHTNNVELVVVASARGKQDERLWQAGFYQGDDGLWTSDNTWLHFPYSQQISKLTFTPANGKIRFTLHIHVTTEPPHDFSDSGSCVTVPASTLP